MGLAALNICDRFAALNLLKQQNQVVFFGSLCFDASVEDIHKLAGCFFMRLLTNMPNLCGSLNCVGNADSKGLSKL